MLAAFLACAYVRQLLASYVYKYIAIQNATWAFESARATNVAAPGVRKFWIADGMGGVASVDFRHSYFGQFLAPPYVRH